MLNVIIVTFNAEETIEETLKSVLSYSKVCRVIIKDGGSLDFTCKRVQAFSDSRIELYSFEDAGIYDAMNFAIGKVPLGEYFCFINSGDALVIESDDAFALSSYNIIFYDVLIRLRENSYKRFKTNVTGTVKKLHHQGIIVRKEQDQILFDLSIGLMSDLDWMTCLLEKYFNNYKLVPDVLSCISPGGISDLQSFKRLGSYIKFCKKNHIKFYITFDFYKILAKVFMPYKIVMIYRRLVK